MKKYQYYYFLLKQDLINHINERKIGANYRPYIFYGEEYPSIILSSSQDFEQWEDLITHEYYDLPLLDYYFEEVKKNGIYRIQVYYPWIKMSLQEFKRDVCKIEWYKNENLNETNLYVITKNIPDILWSNIDHFNGEKWQKSSIKIYK